jgi:sugar lactone lactonase YvrE
VITTVAGNGINGFGGDNGPAIDAQLNLGNDIAVDSDGNLYIPDAGNNCVRKVSNGVITTIAGNGSQYPDFRGDNGPALGAKLNHPYAVALDSAGNLYIADSGNFRIRKVSNGIITTVAGNGTESFGGDDGPAVSAQLNRPSAVAVDGAGNVYIADTSNNRVRKVSGGVITTVAGTLIGSYSGDNGPARSAHLYYPSGVAVDTAGNLYIADQGNYRIRKVTNGVIKTVAGGGAQLGDNVPATSAQLVPSGVAVDTAGNLYITDIYYNRVRKVSNGVITTIAGNGTAGFSGDGGPAMDAQLNAPGGVAVDSAGNVYIADTRNGRVRMISDGAITTVAGGGTQGSDGPATDARLGALGVAVDSGGNLYIVDGRVLRASNGVITTIAGNGTTGFSGDGGPAIGAQMSAYGVTVDSSGNAYVADADNDRIRVLTPDTPPSVFPTAQQTSELGAAGKQKARKLRRGPTPSTRSW